MYCKECGKRDETITETCNFCGSTNVITIQQRENELREASPSAVIARQHEYEREENKEKLSKGIYIACAVIIPLILLIIKIVAGG
jgi:uncharacterized membrane protein YvbJ